MTLFERYISLTEPFIFNGKTFAPMIQAPLTIEKLQDYANNMYAKNLPMCTGVADEVRKNMSWAGHELSNTINFPY